MRAGSRSSATVGAPLILGYHSVTPKPQSLLAVKATQFAWQMRWLYRKGFRAVSLSQLHQNVSCEKRLILTFDDGHADCLMHAARILNQLGWIGVVFVIGSYVGTSRDFPWYVGLPPAENGSDCPLSWEQVARLNQEGWEIGSHTNTHPNLTAIPITEAREEIEESKRLIERHLGRSVESFCYPKNQASVEVAELVHRAGYRCAVKSGAPLPQAGDYALPRISIYGDDSFLDFIVKVRYQMRFIRLGRGAQRAVRVFKRLMPFG